jgi:hypothetical protein
VVGLVVGFAADWTVVCFGDGVGGVEVALEEMLARVVDCLRGWHFGGGGWGWWCFDVMVGLALKLCFGANFSSVGTVMA